MYKTWYFDESFEEFQNVIDIVKNYAFEQRFVSHEKVNSLGEEKPHFHILCKLIGTDIKPWNNMIKKIKETYLLKERNELWKKEHGVVKGGYSCFGIAKKDVYSPEKYKRYIAKDGDIWSDIPADELKKIMDEGAKKEEDKNWNQKILEELDKKSVNCRFKIPDSHEYRYCDITIKMEIIKIYRKYEVVVSKSKLENSFNYVSQLSKNPMYRMSDSDLLEYLTRYK